MMASVSVRPSAVISKLQNIERAVLFRSFVRATEATKKTKSKVYTVERVISERKGKKVL